MSASQTLHSLTLAKALELQAADPKKWKGKTPALVRGALELVREESKVRLEIEREIETVLQAERGA